MTSYNYLINSLGVHGQVHCNLPNCDLTSKEWSRIEYNMYPDRLSCSGFLRKGLFIEDDEKLSSVLEKDAQTLDKYNITYKQIADKLREILSSNHDSNLKVTMDGPYLGAQECPFQNMDLDNKYHGSLYGSIDITVTNTILNETFSFNTLLIHMIEQHGFFEGSVPHRVDPEKVIRILNLYKV